MRLDKALTLAGLTRSQARVAIRAGRVQVCGAACQKADAQVNIRDVRLDGACLPKDGEIYIMLNKPAGYVTAMEDARAPALNSLLPQQVCARRPGPVGRLDKDVTGLVLLTTDGQLAHRLISPRRKAEKCYVAQVDGMLTPRHVEMFAAGLPLGDFTAQPAVLNILCARPDGSTAQVILTEGKFHQVKRMFQAVGCPVRQLMRTRIGSVALDMALQSGQWRYLTKEEVAGLKVIAQMEEV